jgi:hypothetical protein
MSVSSNTIFGAVLNQHCDPRGFRSNSEKPLPEGLAVTRWAFFLLFSISFCKNVDSVQFLSIPPIQPNYRPLTPELRPEGFLLARPLPLWPDA